MRNICFIDLKIMLIEFKNKLIWDEPQKAGVKLSLIPDSDCQSASLVRGASPWKRAVM